MPVVGQRLRTGITQADSRLSVSERRQSTVVSANTAVEIVIIFLQYKFLFAV